MAIRYLQSLYQKGKVSPHDVSNYFNERIGAFAKLQAVVTQTSDNSVSSSINQSALRHSSQQAFGPLDGVPFLVKDNFCTDAVRTTCGSNALHNYYPPYSATVVEHLLNAGGHMMGKTNMDEFAMGSGSINGIHGPTRNPWTSRTVLQDTDDFYITGGSSGGSAAAIAAGLSLAAFSSDTGGSTRNPASLCGVVGLKPTYGLVSRYGLISLVNSLDVPGVMANSVEDCLAVFNAVAGPDDRDSTTFQKSFTPVKFEQLPRGLRVGIPIEYHVPGLSPQLVDIWDKVAGWLSDAGCHVQRVSLPHTQHSVHCYSVLCCCEVASNMARFDGIEFGHRAEVNESTEALYAATRRESFNSVVRRRILTGNYYLLRENLDKYLHQAQKVWRLVHDDFQHVFHREPRDGDEGRVDVLLSPVTLSDAPRHSEFARTPDLTRIFTDDMCTQAINLAGVPAISLPFGLSRDGLPLSLQLVGPKFSEQLVFSVAHWLEKRAQFETFFNFEKEFL